MTLKQLIQGMGPAYQLESDLVVTLASLYCTSQFFSLTVNWGEHGCTYAAVADKLAVVLLSNADLGTGDDGTGKRGTEEVAVLVDGVALDGSVDKLLNQFALEVHDNHLLGAEGNGLLLNGGPVLLLTDIGQEADDGITLVGEPFQDSLSYCRWTSAIGRDWSWICVSRVT